MQTKMCTKCGEEKNVNEINDWAGNEYGRFQSVCNDCLIKYGLEKLYLAWETTPKNRPRRSHPIATKKRKMFCRICGKERNIRNINRTVTNGERNIMNVCNDCLIKYNLKRVPIRKQPPSNIEDCKDVHFTNIVTYNRETRQRTRTIHGTACQIKITILKYCPACKEVKPIACFHNNKSHPDGKAAICKECHRLSRRITNEKAKDRLSDRYIANKIYSKYKLKSDYITKEMIDTQRAIIVAKREIKKQTKSA